MPDGSQPAIVRFENVSLWFEGVKVLDSVSFSLGAGETRIVFGAAGSGKTVLLKIALGLIPADAGRVYLFGNDITNLDERHMFDIRSRVGVLFQEGGLFDSLTIEDNVSYPLLNQPGRRVSPEQMPEVEEKVRDALRFVELEGTLEKLPSELSGGMRRRVGIARAVVTEPQLLLYDSPTAGLDPITANTIMALLVKERDLRNAATIMATHRYQDGHLMANFRYNPHSGQLEPLSRDGFGRGERKTIFMVLEQGRLVFEGSQRELESSTDSYVQKFVRR